MLERDGDFSGDSCHGCEMLLTETNHGTEPTNDPTVRIYTREEFRAVAARLMTGAKRVEREPHYPFPHFVGGDSTVFGIRFSRVHDVTIDISHGDGFAVFSGTKQRFEEQPHPREKAAFATDGWISSRVEELATDEIGLGSYTIVAVGRVHARLEGADLVDFVRRVIVGLMRGGATPENDALFSPDNPHGLAHFGADTPEEVADGVVAAWVAKGMPDPKWGDWRFNTAENRAHLDEAAEEKREAEAT